MNYFLKDVRPAPNAHQHLVDEEEEWVGRYRLYREVLRQQQQQQQQHAEEEEG